MPLPLLSSRKTSMPKAFASLKLGCLASRHLRSKAWLHDGDFACCAATGSAARSARASATTILFPAALFCGITALVGKRSNWVSLLDFIETSAAAQINESRSVSWNQPSASFFPSPRWGEGSGVRGKALLRQEGFAPHPQALSPAGRGG